MGFEKDKASSSSHILQIPREDTPLLANTQHLSSPSKTFANVFIAVVGAGVLGLPYSFKKTGWVMGTLMLLSVATLTCYCMMLLVYSRRKLESHFKVAKISSFGDLGYAVCGSVGRCTVDAMIVMSQAGFCISYLIFIANTLAHLFNYSVTNPSPKILGLSPKKVYIWSCFPFQLGLNSIPTLTHLAPLSIFADVVDLGAMGVVMAEDVLIFLKNRPVLETFGGFSVFFYGLGVSVYAFEGVGMVLPLEAEMKDKEKFGKILGLSMAFISLMYGSFGVLGYFAFGEETKDIITTNLGRGLLSTLVQIGLCINLFFTFPLMMNPVYEVMERRFCEGRYCFWLRWIVVLVVTLVALMVPNFADFLSLVGSSVCIVLGFVLPALFHLIVFKKELGWLGLALDSALVLMGAVLAIYGTYSSMLEIFGVKA
ncbi:amino acid transporter AVT3C-like [Nicotiana tabacum]|uniref:Amino acid transporter ANTL2-like n=2 Tax=Nicotiana TaxID=4085 RepID=A0A1S4DI04_TOBAC|nr:PREDICTED: proton-coupled amino acid transporter 3-like [Nicotiana sylvestris]XP_016513025.1 PREDICTED: amino acid transporter ANTL2-like [Nicotiana tabacum]